MNGWQRLWTVGTILLGIYAIGFGIVELDTKSSLMREHDSQVSWHRHQIETIRTDKSRAPDGVTPETAIAEIKSDIADLDNRLERELKTVTPTLIKNIFTLFGLWLGTSVLVYLAGMIIHWVYRGFRPKAAS